MKTIFVLLLLSQAALAQVEGTYHKTENGKYPFYFQGTEWNETNQKDYDVKMGSTLKQLCSDSVSLGRLEQQYQDAEQNYYSDAKNKNTFFSDVQLGKKIENTKNEIIKLSGIVVRGTGKDARDWGCQ